MAVVATDEELALTVEDDGTGPPPAGTPTGGRGLANLTTRARRLGGSFELSPRDRGGSIASWRVPRER